MIYSLMAIAFLYVYSLSVCFIIAGILEICTGREEYKDTTERGMRFPVSVRRER